MNAQMKLWGMNILQRIEQAGEWMAQVEANESNLTLIESEIMVDKLLELEKEVQEFNQLIGI